MSRRFIGKQETLLHSIEYSVPIITYRVHNSSLIARAAMFIIIPLLIIAVLKLPSRCATLVVGIDCYSVVTLARWITIVE